MKRERQQRLEEFKKTGAVAEIGCVAFDNGTYTVNTLQGVKKPNFNNVEFNSEIEAVVCFAKQYGQGTLKKIQNPHGTTYLVFTK